MTFVRKKLLDDSEDQPLLDRNDDRPILPGLEYLKGQDFLSLSQVNQNSVIILTVLKDPWLSPNQTSLSKAIP